MKTLKDRLLQETNCEIFFDTITRRIYSVDASIFEIEPLGVAIPQSKQDAIMAVKIALEMKVPIIPRGAATGITGGCLGKGLILDTSKFLNKIHEINFEEEYVICEPGVIQDDLNRALAVKGYRLGPDTSTGNRATIGGMIGNNAAGARSLRYGKMVDHVLEAEMIMASGEVEVFRLGQGGRYYDAVKSVIDSYREDIIKHYPPLPRRASGYNLDYLLANPFNLCQLIAGSEGSLGVLTQVKLRIARVPNNPRLVVIHYHSLQEAFEAIEEILTHHPLSLELIDDKILSAAKHADWLQGNPEAVLVAEFEEGLESFIQTKRGYAYTIPENMQKVWETRKAGLGILMSKRSYNQAIAFLEDISVPPHRLAEFMPKFMHLIKRDAGIYGHAGSGCMHIRPYVDLRDPQEALLMKQLMLDATALLQEYGGALSGEHGDGLIRSWLNEKLYGPRIYSAFKEIKHIFDPHNLMNPGKVVNGPEPEHFRYENVTPVETFMKFNGGLALSADLCNGNAQCRKKEGLMCPSFQVTRDEYDTTRARANALRSVIHGNRSLADDDLHDILDLCVECKGCKSDCPSQVDMARMKAETLYHHHQKHGSSLRSWIFGHLSWLVRLPSPPKWLLNWIGIAPQRNLPQKALVRFSEWFKTHKQASSDKKIVLFNDTYNEFNHPEIGQAAVKVLNAMGFEVIVPPWTCCGRPAISKGFLPHAKKQAHEVYKTLQPYLHLPIIGLEPSCILSFIDEYADFDCKIEAMPFSTFLAQHPLPPLKTPLKPILFHGHCHHKALLGMQDMLHVLKQIPDADVKQIDSGCCGMAGSFGYEAEHYDFSMKIGNLKLIPALQGQEAYILADGFSCRTQIHDGAQQNAIHLAELLNELL